jgi:hypothetical protein
MTQKRKRFLRFGKGIVNSKQPRMRCLTFPGNHWVKMRSKSHNVRIAIFIVNWAAGKKISTFVVHLRDGKFHDVHRGTTVDTGQSYDQLLNDLKAWIVKNHPDEASAVLKDDDFQFNKSTAEQIMKLAREWRQAASK